MANYKLRTDDIQSPKFRCCAKIYNVNVIHHQKLDTKSISHRKKNTISIVDTSSSPNVNSEMSRETIKIERNSFPRYQRQNCGNNLSFFDEISPTMMRRSELWNFFFWWHDKVVIDNIRFSRCMRVQFIFVSFSS